jgi:hypothetical protein
MNLLDLFRRRPRFDQLKLVGAAAMVFAALRALETHIEGKDDKRGLVLVRALHAALAKAWDDHAAAMGVDVIPFSGSPIKPSAD